jgi:hypothetical protein
MSSRSLRTASRSDGRCAHQQASRISVRACRLTFERCAAAPVQRCTKSLSCRVKQMSTCMPRRRRPRRPRWRQASPKPHRVGPAWSGAMPRRPVRLCFRQRDRHSGRVRLALCCAPTAGNPQLRSGCRRAERRRWPSRPVARERAYSAARWATPERDRYRAIEIVRPDEPSLASPL